MRTFAETIAKAKRDKLDSMLVDFYLLDKNARELALAIAETVAEEETAC